MSAATKKNVMIKSIILLIGSLTVAVIKIATDKTIITRTLILSCLRTNIINLCVDLIIYERL